MYKLLTGFMILSLCWAGCHQPESKRDPSIARDSLKSLPVVLITRTGNIDGTLSIPVSQKPMTLVVIVAGSGRTDRDGNNSMGINASPYRMLADSLYRAGIASLRYDKRGVGNSQSALKSESQLTFDNYIDDAAAWVDTLRKDKRFNHIVLLGHSEGSLIGMVAAQRSGCDAFISVAGAGRSIDQLLQEQIQAKVPKSALDTAERVLQSLRAGKMDTALSTNWQSLFRPSVQPYLISWMKYDPAKEIMKLKVPVLLLQGTTDMQVSVHDVKLLSNTDTKATLNIIVGMNHVLKPAPPDQKANMATYSNPTLSLHPGLMPPILKFIQSIQ